MERDTVANYIEPLGRIDFQAACRVVMTKFFGHVMDSDRTGDGGSDYLIMKDGAIGSTAYQRTVQAKGWQAKALEDAKKAVEDLGATSFYFLTSRKRQVVPLLTLARDIKRETGVPVTCLGAYEIAELLITGRLLAEFFTAIDQPLAVELPNRPDLPEILLHSYIALSSDSLRLRKEVYTDSLLVSLRALGHGTRAEIVKKAADLLGLDVVGSEGLNRQFDSVQGRGLVKRVDEEGRYELADSVADDLKSAEAMYVQQMAGLARSQKELLAEEFSVTWTEEHAQQAAVFLARLFVRHQLDQAKSSELSLASTAFSKTIGDPEEELRVLLREAGLTPKKIDSALTRLVQAASGNDLIRKLVCGAVYVAVQDSGPLSGARVLGVKKWDSVDVFLDASVAIPYLCARFFMPTEGRFSAGTTRSLRVFEDRSANLLIPSVYLNECAAHLQLAAKYEPLISKLGPAALEYSRNGYVSQYCLLKNSPATVPPSLLGFLRKFSSNVSVNAVDFRSVVQRIQLDLERLYGVYGISVLELKQASAETRAQAETSLTFALKERKARSRVQVEHDAHVLGSLLENTNNRAQLLLTWDGAMIKAAAGAARGLWVVSPAAAADLAQLAGTSGDLCSLAHALAGAQEKPREAAARILDHIVIVASEKLQDWEFLDRIEEFYTSLLKSDLETTARLERQTADFLKENLLQEPGSDG